MTFNKAHIKGLNAFDDALLTQIAAQFFVTKKIFSLQKERMVWRYNVETDVCLLN